MNADEWIMADARPCRSENWGHHWRVV